MAEVPLEVNQARSRTAFVAVALALLTAAFVLTKTGRDALFFQERGLYDLPRAYIGIALLSLPMAGIVLSLMRFLGARRARIVAPLAASAALVAFAPVLRPGGGATMTFFFLFVPLAFGVLFSLSWLLAADFLETAPRAVVARAYGTVGAASMLGGILGAAGARACAGMVEPRGFVLLGALTLASAAGVMAAAQIRFPPAASDGDASSAGMPSATTTARRPSRTGSSVMPLDLVRLLRSRYAVLLFATGGFASLVGILVEFQFYLAAATSTRTIDENARFFAGFYLILNAAALVVQVVVLPHLQRIAGVHGSLFVLPAALLGGASMLLANASLAARSLLRVAEGGIKSSIHRVSWEQAYLPLGAAQRAATKLLVDGAGARLAEGLAAGILWFWLHRVVAGDELVGRSTTWVTYLLLSTSIVWIALTRALGRRLARATPVGSEPFRLEIPLPDT